MWIFPGAVQIRATLALWIVSACVQVLTQNPGDEILNIVVDQRLTLAPVGSFAGVATNVSAPEIERTSNNDLYVKSENLNFQKSSDAGQIDGQAEITSARYDELLKILAAVIESAVRCNLASSNLG